MRSIVRGGLGLVVAGALLLGCGGDDDEAGTAAGAATTEAPVTGDAGSDSDTTGPAATGSGSDLFTEDPRLCDLYPVEAFAEVAGNTNVVVGEQSYFPDEDGSRGQADAYCIYRVAEGAQVSSGGISLSAYPTVDNAVTGLQGQGQYSSDRVPLAGHGDEAVTWDSGEQSAARIGTIVVTASFGDYYDAAAPDAPSVERLLGEVLAALAPVLP